MLQIVVCQQIREARGNGQILSKSTTSQISQEKIESLNRPITDKEVEIQTFFTIKIQVQDPLYW